MLNHSPVLFYFGMVSQNRKSKEMIWRDQDFVSVIGRSPLGFAPLQWGVTVDWGLVWNEVVKLAFERKKSLINVFVCFLFPSFFFACLSWRKTLHLQRSNTRNFFDHNLCVSVNYHLVFTRLMLSGHRFLMCVCHLQRQCLGGQIP